MTIPHRATGHFKATHPGLGRCRARLRGCTGKATERHHLKPQSDGGSDSGRNLLHVCRTCHVWIHRHPGKAYDAGLLIHAADGEPERPR